MNAIHERHAAGQHCGVAFIDIQNALPSVDHKILIAKLKHYGISGCLLQWLAAFLSDRTMYVRHIVDSEIVKHREVFHRARHLDPCSS